MLKIMADVFSGRPNPAWVLTDEQEARTILREFAQNRTLVAQAAPPEAGLGFRGFFVELLSDELARDVDLPTALYIVSVDFLSQVIFLCPSGDGIMS